jgi:hypothetical protein
MNHQAFEHEGTTHKCGDCDYIGKSLDYLQVHQKWNHEERKFVCTQCESKYPYLTNLKMHGIPV